MPRQNILKALFDVRPKKSSEGLVVAKVVNLRRAAAALAPLEPPLPPLTVRGEPALPAGRRRDSFFTRQLIGDTPLATDKDIIAKEIEDVFNKEDTPVAHLIRAGAKFHSVRSQQPDEPAPAQQKQSEPVEEPEPAAESHGELETFWHQPTPRVITTRASYEPQYRNPFPVASVPVPAQPAGRPKKNSPPVATSPRRRITRRGLIGALLGTLSISGFAVAAVSSGEIVAKKSVMQDGTSALANLEHAKNSLENLQFTKAADDFALAN